MASSWQSSHYIVVLGASALAFGAGYTIGGRPAQRAPEIIAENTAAPVFPTAETNQAEVEPPPARPGRMDENELIAANAEPEDGQAQRPPAAGQPPRDRGSQRPDRGSRDDRGSEQQPPEDDFQQQDEQDPYGPEGE